MVGLIADKVELTPLEQAIKGHYEIDQRVTSSIWYYVYIINNKF
jgi:hypothetical protein